MASLKALVASLFFYGARGSVAEEGLSEVKPEDRSLQMGKKAAFASHFKNKGGHYYYDDLYYYDDVYHGGGGKKGGRHKGGNYKGDMYYDDFYYDDFYGGYDDYYHGGSSGKKGGKYKGGMSYDDYYYDDYYGGYDDYYHGGSSGKKGGRYKGGYKGAYKGAYDDYYYDDYYGGHDDYHYGYGGKKGGQYKGGVAYDDYYYDDYHGGYGGYDDYYYDYGYGGKKGGQHKGGAYKGGYDDYYYDDYHGYDDYYYGPPEGHPPYSDCYKSNHGGKKNSNFYNYYCPHPPRASPVHPPPTIPTEANFRCENATDCSSDLQCFGVGCDCFAFTCVTAAPLRISLAWQGTGDLDLAVVTPTHEIVSAFDHPQSGSGFFDPITFKQQGSVFDDFIYVESIYFPSTPVPGTYVVVISQKGGPYPADDNFMIGVYRGEEEVDFDMGIFFAGSTEQEQVYYIPIS